MQEDVNQVLAGYEAARESPQGARLEEWVARHPEHARELARYAAGCAMLERAESCPTAEPDEETLLERAALRAEERLRGASRAAQARIPGILALAQRKGMGLRDLARELGLGLAATRKLDQRMIAAGTIPRELVRRIAGLLEIGAGQVAAYLRMPPTLAAAADYRADRAPHAAAQESFEAVLRASTDTPPEQREYWLAALGPTLDEED